VSKEILEMRAILQALESLEQRMDGDVRMAQQTSSVTAEAVDKHLRDVRGVKQQVAHMLESMGDLRE